MLVKIYVSLSNVFLDYLTTINNLMSVTDDHDVLKLSVSSLRSPEMGLVKDQSTEDNPDSRKIEEEFEQYQAKLKQQKEDWAKEHPDQVGNHKWS